MKYVKAFIKLAKAISALLQLTMDFRLWFLEKYFSTITHQIHNSKLNFGMDPSKILIWIKSAGYPMFYMIELLQN